MSHLTPHVKHRLEEWGLSPETGPLVVGVSGGIDSTVLLHLLHDLSYDLVAAHVNYQLRPGADADQRFVETQCETLGVPLLVRKVDGKRVAKEMGESVQAASRHVRYQFCAQIAGQVQASAVAMAHHREDQAETVLLQLLRGSGPEGLAGMAPIRKLYDHSPVKLVRPLLEVHRRDIEAYAKVHELSWREDPTNESLSYERGIVRKKILPLLHEHFDREVTESMARSADLVRRYVDATLQPTLEKHWEAVAEQRRCGGILNLDRLRKLPHVWQTRILLEALRRWLPNAPRSAATADSLHALLTAQTGRQIPWPGGTIWREREGLLFERDPRRPIGEIPIPQLPGMANLPVGSVRAEQLNEHPGSLHPDDPLTVIVDQDRVTLPLTVRPWRAGDVLQPLGMEGHKNVSDLLTDAKVPTHLRRRILVVCDKTRIIWVVGTRISHHVRIRPDTTHFAKLTFNPADPAMLPGH